MPFSSLDDDAIGLVVHHAAFEALPALACVSKRLRDGTNERFGCTNALRHVRAQAATLLQKVLPGHAPTTPVSRWYA